jgi:phosphohistidine phosphatase SixA
MFRQDDSTLDCLLVTRHGDPSDLAPLQYVAERLAETAQSARLKIVTIQCSETPAAQLTADMLVRGLDLDACSKGPELPMLGPGALDKIQVRCMRNEIDNVFEAMRADARRTTGLIVGHQPAIDQVLDRWVRRESVALAAGEVACLVRRPQTGTLRPSRWRLWWILSPSTARSTQDLRAKVQSKMTVVALLAGFATTIMGGILVQLPTDDTGKAIAVGAAGGYGVTAAVLVGALLAYDRLMMPARFWPSGRPAETGSPLRTWSVARPPSSIDWVLYQHSVRTWRWVVRALGMAWLATSALIVAGARRRARRPPLRLRAKGSATAPPQKRTPPQRGRDASARRATPRPRAGPAQTARRAENKTSCV